jgi:hypothetical protein
VGAFWADAQDLFETARQASQAGSPDCDWAILIGPPGGIRMLEATGWELPSLLIEHGAHTGYRVIRQGGRVSLEGRRGSETCMLRSESPAATARHLLERLPPPIGSSRIPPARTLLEAPHPTPHAPTEDLWKMFS